MRGTVAGLAAGLMLAACVPEVTVVSTAPPENACGAAELQGLVGQDVAVFETMALQGSWRIIRPGQAVTMDFSAERLNVEVDGNERISRITCG